jgi:hypothetical protein
LTVESSKISSNKNFTIGLESNISHSIIKSASLISIKSSVFGTISIETDKITTSLTTESSIESSNKNFTIGLEGDTSHNIIKCSSYISIKSSVFGTISIETDKTVTSLTIESSIESSNKNFAIGLEGNASHSIIKSTSYISRKSSVFGTISIETDKITTSLTTESSIESSNKNFTIGLEGYFIHIIIKSTSYISRKSSVFGTISIETDKIATSLTIESSKSSSNKNFTIGLEGDTSHSIIKRAS